MKMMPKMRGSWRSSSTSFHITKKIASHVHCLLQPPRRERQHERRIHGRARRAAVQNADSSAPLSTIARSATMKYRAGTT